MKDAVKRTLLVDYGQQKAGEEVICHVSLIPLLVERGIIEAEVDAEPEAEEKPKTKKSKK